MASAAYIETLLGSVAGDVKKAMKDVFTYLLRNVRFGRPGDAEPAENFSGHFYLGRTHAVSGTEFVIAHKLERAPYLAIPVLDLQTVGSETIPLQVTRAADSSFIYLASAEEDVPFVLYAEG